MTEPLVLLHTLTHTPHLHMTRTHILQAPYSSTFSFPLTTDTLDRRYICVSRQTPCNPPTKQEATTVARPQLPQEEVAVAVAAVVLVEVSTGLFAIPTSAIPTTKFSSFRASIRLVNKVRVAGGAGSRSHDTRSFVAVFF